jgi:hypothetical protein
MAQSGCGNGGHREQRLLSEAERALVSKMTSNQIVEGPAARLDPGARKLAKATASSRPM